MHLIFRRIRCTHITSCRELRLLANVLWYPSLLGDVVVGIVADSMDIGEAISWEGDAARERDAPRNEQSRARSPITAAALSARQVLFSNHYGLLTAHARSLARSFARLSFIWSASSTVCSVRRALARARSIASARARPTAFPPPPTRHAQQREDQGGREREGWAEQSAAKGIRRPRGAEGRSPSPPLLGGPHKCGREPLPELTLEE